MLPHKSIFVQVTLTINDPHYLHCPVLIALCLSFMNYVYLYFLTSVMLDICSYSKGISMQTFYFLLLNVGKYPFQERSIGLYLM